VEDRDKEVQNHSLIVYLRELRNVLDAGLESGIYGLFPKDGDHDFRPKGWWG
jgi:hypothetical protein